MALFGRLRTVYLPRMTHASVTTREGTRTRKLLPLAEPAGSVPAAPDAELDEGWQETHYLLASPANAAILRAAADRSSDIAMNIDEVWANFGVPKE